MHLMTFIRLERCTNVDAVCMREWKTDTAWTLTLLGFAHTKWYLEVVLCYKVLEFHSIGSRKCKLSHISYDTNYTVLTFLAFHIYVFIDLHWYQIWVFSLESKTVKKRYIL